MKRGKQITDPCEAFYMINLGVSLFNHQTKMMNSQWREKKAGDIIKLVRSGKVFHTYNLHSVAFTSFFEDVTEQEIDSALESLNREVKNVTALYSKYIRSA